MIPRSLLSACAEEKLIPIVGAGVSMSLKTKAKGQLFPSWKDLLHKAADRLKQENKHELSTAVTSMLALNKYEQAADFAREGLTGGLWNSFFSEIFNVKREIICDESLALPRAIWGIGNQIITLNYDKVLRFACPEQGVNELDNNDTSALVSFGHPGRETHSIWHMHGRIDQTNEIIFTSESYSKLYSDRDSKYSAALTKFQSLSREHAFDICRL